MTQGRSPKSNPTPESLIAPCGMNCFLCRAYGRAKKPCPGCRGDDAAKSKSCLACRIKNCAKLAAGTTGYCFECGSFPCVALKHLDKRYRTRYGMSMIENLNEIKSLGIREFLENEAKRWTCSGCGGVVCVHNPECIHCGQLWRNGRSVT